MAGMVLLPYYSGWLREVAQLALARSGAAGIAGPPWTGSAIQLCLEGGATTISDDALNRWVPLIGFDTSFDYGTSTASHGQRQG